MGSGRNVGDSGARWEGRAADKRRERRDTSGGPDFSDCIAQPSICSSRSVKVAAASLSDMVELELVVCEEMWSWMQVCAEE